MSSLVEITGGLAARLKTITAFDQNVLTVVRRPAVFPAGIIVPPPIPDYGESLEGTGAELDVRFLVVVGVTEAEQQTNLFEFIDWTGPSSIYAAVEADRTLGLPDIDAHVRAANDPAPGLIEFPDESVAYGVGFLIRIVAGG